MQANTTLSHIPDDVFRYALASQREMRRLARILRTAPPTDEQIAAALARATGAALDEVTAELDRRRR